MLDPIKGVKKVKYLISNSITGTYGTSLGTWSGIVQEVMSKTTETHRKIILLGFKGFDGPFLFGLLFTDDQDRLNFSHHQPHVSIDPP